MNQESVRLVQARLLYYFTMTKSTGTARLKLTSAAQLLEIESDDLVRELMLVAKLLPKGCAASVTDQSITVSIVATSGNVREVFSYWQVAMGKPKAKLCTKRRGIISARLREGYDLATIKAAIDGCRASSWHQGDNPNGQRYDDLTVICRDGARLEAFADQDQLTTSKRLNGGIRAAFRASVQSTKR